MRVARTPEDAARARRLNLRTAPVLLFLGGVEVLSGAIALAAHIDPLILAVWGLVTLLLAIAVIALAALVSRRQP